MTFARTLSSIIALTFATLATSAWAATDDQRGAHQASSTAAVPLAQATHGSTGMGMGGKSTTPDHADQMKAMQEMHNKMQAAKTPEERNALMAEQMQIMQNGMNMMGGMGGMGGMGASAMMGKPSDMAAHHGMPDERMDMMQSMMQMMMDRMQSIPAAK